MGYLDKQGSRIDKKKKTPRYLDVSGKRLAPDPRADWASTADPRMGSGKVEYDIEEPIRRAKGHLAEVPGRTVRGLKKAFTPFFMREKWTPPEEGSTFGDDLQPSAIIIAIAGTFQTCDLT